MPLCSSAASLFDNKIAFAATRWLLPCRVLPGMKRQSWCEKGGDHASRTSRFDANAAVGAAVVASMETFEKLR